MNIMSPNLEKEKEINIQRADDRGGPMEYVGCKLCWSINGIEQVGEGNE